jgi:hypothetical protein
LLDSSIALFCSFRYVLYIDCNSLRKYSNSFFLNFSGSQSDIGERGEEGGVLKRREGSGESGEGREGEGIWNLQQNFLWVPQHFSVLLFVPVKTVPK